MGSHTLANLITIATDVPNDVVEWILHEPWRGGGGVDRWLEHRPEIGKTEINLAVNEEPAENEYRDRAEAR